MRRAGTAQPLLLTRTSAWPGDLRRSSSWR